jgi:hypothetical protein
MGDPIRVWQFGDAPKEFRELSTNGGDEDWVAHIPKELLGTTWVDMCMSENQPGGRYFCCCCIVEFTLPDGSEIRIGCHA